MESILQAKKVAVALVSRKVARAFMGKVHEMKIDSPKKNMFKQ